MSRRLRADLSLALCPLLWGATFVVVKNALDRSSVFIFLAVRFSVAAVLMLAWNSRALRRIEREDLFAGLRLGCFMFLGYAFQPLGPQDTTSSHAAILFTLEPVFAVITSYLMIRERLGPRAMLGAIFVLAGIFVAEMLFLAAAPESPEPIAGLKTNN